MNTELDQDSLDRDHSTSDDSEFAEPNVADNTSKRRSKIKIIIAASALCLCGLLLANHQFAWFSSDTDDEQTADGPPPAAVAIARAQEMTMAPHTTLPGSVVSVRDAVIATEASGKVLSVANIGDIVETGDSIAEIDPQNAEQLVAQRKAELERLQSLYKYHKDYFARVNIEEEKLGIPEIGIAELRSNMETAKADVARAETALTSAETDLKRTSITAPFPGRIVSQSIQPGEYAQVGSSIARLVDTRNLEVSARVPAALVQPIAAGTKLNISGMGKTVNAPLRALVPVGDAVSRTMELRVTLADTTFMVGSPVTVSLPSAQARKVVAIPRDAVILRTDAKYVFVIDEKNVAHQRNVQLGYAEGDMIEVIGDVPSDATVIVRGGERLRDGQQVSWQTEAEKPAAVVSLER